jgi:hypothetical protein
MQSRYKRKNQDFTGHQQDIKALQAENTRFKEYLQNAPDALELFYLCARLKSWRGITLKQDLEALNNYIVITLQVQTLINQNAIEALELKKPWWRFW